MHVIAAGFEMQRAVVGLGSRGRSTRQTSSTGALFQGKWNPTRRRNRSTLEYSTLPLRSANRFTLAPGGAMQGAAAATGCLAFVLRVVVWVARVAPRRF